MNLRLFCSFPSLHFAKFLVPGGSSMLCCKHTDMKVYEIGYCRSALISNIVNRSFSTCKSKLKPPWKVIFFGTDNFALKSIQPLCAKLRTGTLMNELAVVAQKGSIVRKFAEAEKLSIIEWPIKQENILNKFDIGVVVSFGHLIPKEIIAAIPLGIVNVHGSLLPRWRGAAPIVYAVMNSDSETGVTIMKIDPHRFDTGAIVRQYRCAISPSETAAQVTDRLATQGASLLMECVRDLPKCVEMATPQPTDGVTYAPKVTSELACVDWTKMTAKRVYDLHRAVSHLHPLTTHWHGSQTRLLDIQLDLNSSSSTQQKSSPDHSSSQKAALNFLNSSSDSLSSRQSNIVSETSSKPGQIVFDKVNKTLSVECADGLKVLCGGFRIGGKSVISPHEFYNGYLSKKNAEEWYFT